MKMTRNRLALSFCAAALILLIVVLFLFSKSDQFPERQVLAEALITQNSIELSADFSQLQKIEDAVLYLYTPHSYYSLGDTTAESPIFGNDVRKEIVKAHIAKENNIRVENVGLDLSTGVTHPGQAKTTFYLQKLAGDVDKDKFRVFIVTTKKGWFNEEFHIEEMKMHSAK